MSGSGVPHVGVLGLPVPEETPVGRIPHEGILGMPIDTPEVFDPRLPHTGILGGPAMPPTSPAAPEGPRALRGSPLLTDDRLRVVRNAVRALEAAQASLWKRDREICGISVDNVALARENARLRASLKKTLDLSVKSPVFKGGLGGRTAIEAYRGNTGAFIEIMNEVGVRAQVFGEQAAEFFLMGPVKLDLECLWAAPPATEEEGRRRDDLRHKLSAPHERALLVRPDEIGERYRQQFISDVAGSGVDTSTQELVRRSGELARGGTAPAWPDE
ncbi:MAG: hypothetical protein ACREC5_02025 [Thermoplasmata archaeon]